jgi:hypothetical protein
VTLAHPDFPPLTKEFKNTIYYFDGLQISEQFAYILTSVKAVFPRYLRQGGANFELHLPFFNKQKQCN